MLNKMNKIEIYVANEDTDINPSVQEAIEYVLKQNDPVGTVAGYYDEKLTIWSVSNYFLQLLGWDDLLFLFLISRSLPVLCYLYLLKVSTADRWQCVILRQR